MSYEQGLVTVLTPAYNRVRYIDQVIESVAAQKYKNFEHIVIDDGSTDGTYEKLEEYEKQGKVTLLAHAGRINKGQSAALNLGLKSAKGEFICILDSDDYFHPDKLSDQVACLQNNPDTGLVFGRSVVVDDSGIEQYCIPFAEPKGELNAEELLLDCFIVSPGCALMRAAVISRIGVFNESYRAAQDHDFALRIAENSAIKYLDKLCFFYRKHGDSISEKGLERRWQAGFEILKNASARYPYGKKIVRKRRAVLHYHMSKVRLAEKKSLSAIGHLVCCVALDPIRSIHELISKIGA